MAAVLVALFFPTVWTVDIPTYPVLPDSMSAWSDSEDGDGGDFLGPQRRLVGASNSYKIFALDVRKRMLEGGGEGVARCTLRWT